MLRRGFVRSMLLGSLAATGVRANVAAPRPQVWGYYPWWLGEHWRSCDLSLYDRLQFFEVEIGDDGALGQRNGWPRQWQDLQRAAHAGGPRLDVTLTLFSTARFERVFASPSKRRRLLAEVLRLGAGAQGIHLDVEVFDPVSDAALRGYRAFCAELRSGLKRRGAAKVVSAFGVMGAAVDLYNRATLAQLDYIVVQGYDSHHLESPRSGPVAALRGPYEVTWERTLAHYLRLGASRRSIIFSVPFFGYEWPTDAATAGARTLGKGRETTYALLDAQRLPSIRIGARAQAVSHGLQRDAESGSPYYAYQEPSGGWRQGWFEDDVSLAAKFEFVQQQRLVGVATFPVGYDGGAFDDLLRRAFRGK